MLKALEAVWFSLSVAVIVKLLVVSADTEGAVPVIAPVDVFSEPPLGSAPDVTAYVIVPPSDSAAATVNDIESPSATLPKLPAFVVHVGKALYTDVTVTVPPSVLVIFKSWFPAAFAGATTDNCVAEFSVIDVALVPPKVTVAPVLKLVPLISKVSPPAGSKAVLFPG